MREKYQRAIDEFVRRAVERYKDRIDEIISANLLYEKREKADYDIYYKPGKEEAKGEAINIGSYKEITILELAKLIRDLTNSSSEIVFSVFPKDNPTRRKPNITKAEELLRRHPKIEPKEGLLRAIEWFKEEVGITRT